MISDKKYEFTPNVYMETIHEALVSPVLTENKL